MSQIYFSKQNLAETVSRLSLLANSKGEVIIWLKGNKDKYTHKVISFNQDRMELVLEEKDINFSSGQSVLCCFSLRGMDFFSEVIFQKSVSQFCVLQFKNILFKSERRSSFRLLTYPIYEVIAEFDLGLVYKGGKVLDFKTRVSQTGLFKSFLKIMDNQSDNEEAGRTLKIRVQDLSTTGIAVHIGALELEYFKKDHIFENVNIRFSDDVIQISKLKVMYVVDYISGDKSLKMYKVGIHFENLSNSIDDKIGKKINTLLRSNDLNKDFENFIK